MVISNKSRTFALAFQMRAQMVPVVQLVRASDCGSECRGFESHLPPIRSSSLELLFCFPQSAKHAAKHIPRTAKSIPFTAKPLPFTTKPLIRPTAIVPTRRGSPPPRLEYIPAKLESTLAKLEGALAKLEGTLAKLEDTLAKLEGISTQLLTTSGDACRTIRASVSDETRIRTVRYVHPRRPIRASNDGHGVAEPAHNQCLADR